MARTEQARVAFNRGLISRLALARVDLKRMAFSSEIQVNWMPRTLGSMMLRPGWGYLGATAGNARPKYLPFIFAIDDTALLEFTNAALRIWIDDALLTRGSVSSTVTNGNFDANLTGWTDNDEAGGTSDWVVGGYMGLTGNGTAAAIRDQTVTVAAADQGDEHALRIVVHRGPVMLRVGTSTTDDSYINETELATGTHSLAFTPTGNFNIRFMSRLERQVLVDSCNVEAAGVVSLTSPYATADLRKIRYDQSGDVVFIACGGIYTQRRVERRAARSWSIVQYLANDGPFRTENLGPTTITPSALVGNITLTASAPLFRATHAPSANNAGALFRITSSGQTVTQTATAQNTFTNAIRVTGVDAARVFGLTVTGLSGTGSTVTLQRSLESETGTWTDVASYTTDQSTSYDDGLDNQIAWYRIGVKTGGYSTGTIVMTLTYAAGAIDGIARVTEYTSSTVVNAEVLTDLGGTAATAIWAEGRWSDFRGWPSAVAFCEGRLTWHGKDRANCSISDAFDSFDADFEGDAGPIDRSIGSGPVDSISWALPLQRLVLGGQGAEYSCRSTAFDEPLTPTNFNIKPSSTQGSADVGAVKIDSRGAFVQRGGTRVFELAFNSEVYDYSSTDMTLLIPEIGQPSIVAMAVQRQPDTRLHCVRSDGMVAVLVTDKAENVLSWQEVETDGEVEDVVVLPGEDGDEEDRVYYAVARTINGSTVRYLERWAMESECIGGTLNKQADAFITGTNSPASTSISVPHLAGEEIIVWQDGVCPDDDGEPKTFTADGSGNVTLDDAASQWVAGLAYEAPWKSAKLGQTLDAFERVDHIGFILADTHAKGLKFGPSLDEDEMDPLPLKYRGETVDPDRVYSDFDDQPIEFPGEWGPDARICLLAKAPRPATVLAAVVRGEANA